MVITLTLWLITNFILWESFCFWYKRSALELLYRDDSLFSDEQIVSGLRKDMARLHSLHEILRFGSSELGIEGIDKKKNT